MKELRISKYNQNIILNYIFKILSVLAGLLSTRITIDYLGNSLYGLWVTIASIVAWMSSGDFGISNGFRNLYAEAYSSGDEIKQDELISAGARTLLMVSVVLYFFFILIIEVLLYFTVIEQQIRIPMYITGLFFVVNMTLGIAQSICYGRQNSWLVTAAVFSGALATMISIIILRYLDIPSNLTYFSFVHGFCSIIPNLFLLVYLKTKSCDLIKICSTSRNLSVYRRSITNAGLLFFGIQLCNIVLNSTDNLIINYLLDSNNVTKYAVITKIYNAGQMFFSILLISLWSAVTFQVTRKNYTWIKKEVKKLLLIWILYSVGVIFVSYLINPIIHLWIGEKAFYYELPLVAVFAIYGIIVSFAAIFVNVLNGLQRIKLQLWVSLIGAICNIPLSIFFARDLELGILGVKLATLLSVILIAVVTSLQAIFLLNKKT